MSGSSSERVAPVIALAPWLLQERKFRRLGGTEEIDADMLRDLDVLNNANYARDREIAVIGAVGQPRDRVKIADFEYFGHSNKACFMFDYSSNVDSASKSFLHESQLRQINGWIFARNAMSCSRR